MAKHKVQVKKDGKWVDTKRKVNISADTAKAMNVSADNIGEKYVKDSKAKK